MSQLKSPVMHPQDMNAAFADAYNSRDLKRVLALYEPESILVNPRGDFEQGTAAFRATLHDFLKQEGTLVSKNMYCIPFEDLALLRARYILETVDANGNPATVEGHTSEVVRRQADGSWKYIIDHPFGADPV